MDYKTRRFFRDLTRGLKILAAFTAKMAAAILLLIVGVFFTHYAFTTTSIDDLRFGVLAMEWVILMMTHDYTLEGGSYEVSTMETI